MVETNPLKWFIRDIDIGDSGKSSSSPGKTVGKSGGGTGNMEISPKVEMFGYRPIRTRSRHECHFATGSSVPMGEIDHQQMTQSYHPSTSAHRRRTDLMPTITFNNASPGGTISGSGLSRSSTPGTRMLRSPVKTPEHRTKKPLGKSISTENNDETRSNSSSTASNSKTPR